MMLNKTVTVVAIVLLIACGDNKQAAKVNEEARKKAAEKIAASTKTSLDSLVFDNKKDLVCDMPLSTGVGDTLHYKGKLYGFCSKECKKEFLRKPAEYEPDQKPKKDKKMTMHG
ncbi:MAG: YHS domain-containing protein [Bacteroidetes bacterium]|nr:YHS domain-containing protein [Bacteroidota bacterium]